MPAPEVHPPKKPPLVLSVQSHVVHGYAGNKASVFPLQLLGFEVDVINADQLSCHAGYPASPGQTLDGEDLGTLIQGLAANRLLKHTHLITSSISSVSMLNAVVQLKSRLPPDVCYVCEPLLDDSTQELADVYRATVLPRAQALVPRQRDLELLMQRPVTCLWDVADAVDVLHSMGPTVIVVTALDLPDIVGMLFSSRVDCRKYVLRLPAVGTSVGYAELATALLLAELYVNPYDFVEAFERVGAALSAVLERTSMIPPRTVRGKPVPTELRLLECKRELEHPRVVHRSTVLWPPGFPHFQTIVFDMEQVLASPAREDQVVVPPGTIEALNFLRLPGIRLSVVTTSSDSRMTAVLAELAKRGSGPLQPTVRNPDVKNTLERCCSDLGASPGQVLFVSSRADYLQEAHEVGAVTVGLLMGPEDRPDKELVAKELLMVRLRKENMWMARVADFTVTSLEGLARLTRP